MLLACCWMPAGVGIVDVDRGGALEAEGRIFGSAEAEAEAEARMRATARWEVGKDMFNFSFGFLGL